MCLGACTCRNAHACRSEGSLEDLIFSFYHVGSGDQTQTWWQMPAPLSHLVDSIFIFETGSCVPWVVLRFMAVLQSQTFKYWSLNKPVQKLYLSCKPTSSSTLNTVYYVFITFEYAVWFINLLDLFIHSILLCIHTNKNRHVFVEVHSSLWTRQN